MIPEAENAHRRRPEARDKVASPLRNRNGVFNPTRLVVRLQRRLKFAFGDDRNDRFGPARTDLEGQVCRGFLDFNASQHGFAA